MASVFLKLLLVRTRQAAQGRQPIEQCKQEPTLGSAKRVGNMASVLQNPSPRAEKKGQGLREAAYWCKTRSKSRKSSVVLVFKEFCSLFLG